MDPNEDIQSLINPTANKIIIKTFLINESKGLKGEKQVY